jgi:glycosyltransferase involved in cell wall biosynthesis
MTLRLVYRSYGGENTKRRPHYYSKVLTLTSFVQAARRVPGAEVIFLNDGPIPADRLAIMRRFGEVVQIANQPRGLRASYRAGLALAQTRPWSDHDVVYYVEDDYLFTPDALGYLVEAVVGLPEASYLSLYGNRPDYADPNVRAEHSLPRDWAPAPDVQVCGRIWYNRAGIASTFAARVGVLRADFPIFLQCMLPFRRRFLDHETCLIYQGFVPYHGWELLLGLPEDFTLSARGVLRTIVLIPFRIALNLRARRQQEPHLLYTLTPNEATHLEHPVISADRDWEAVAAQVADWAEANGFVAPAASIRDSLARTL